MVCAGIVLILVCQKQLVLMWKTTRNHTNKNVLYSQNIFEILKNFFKCCISTLHVSCEGKVESAIRSLAKAKNISLTNACCLKFVGFQFHRQELQKWVVVFGCKLCLVIFSYVYNCGWIVWNVSTVSFRQLAKHSIKITTKAFVDL